MWGGDMKEAGLGNGGLGLGMEAVGLRIGTGKEVQAGKGTGKGLGLREGLAKMQAENRCRLQPTGVAVNRCMGLDSLPGLTRVS
jgi:hypothetical protein